MHTRTAYTHAAFFLPHLRPGMSLIDCGCGPGSITIGLAKAVNPGHVVGIDTARSDIESASVRANEQGLDNVEFRVGSIYEIAFPDNSFDAAFAHGVLEHLAKPINALREMYRIVKHGGIIGARSPDYGGHIYAPSSSPVDDSLALIERYVNRNGGSRRIGRHFRAMLREAGFVRIEGSSSYECNGTPDSTQREGEVMAALFSQGHFHDEVIELGLADEPTLCGMAAAWTRWGEHPDAFRASAWCEAIGWKE